jgi:hypothetical protein
MKEYAGPRSANAVGHNFQGELDCGDTPGRALVESLLNVDALSSIVLTRPEAGSVMLFFVRGSETRSQLVLVGRDDDAPIVDWAFNFHFDLTKPDGPSLFEALDKFAESRALAEESVAAMQTWSESR